MGWLMVKKHPDVKAKGKGIDMSDLEKDEVVMFQKRYERIYINHSLSNWNIQNFVFLIRNYAWLMPLFTFILPALVTSWLFNETFTTGWYVGAMMRYMMTVHGTWCVNSFAHYAGSKPYDTNIAATNNTYVGVLGLGEGWHNYHHVFPWDYKTSELGSHHLNWTCAFIDLFAKIGMSCLIS